METKTCAVCRRNFTPSRANQVCCSAPCREDRAREHQRAYDKQRYRRKPDDRERRIARSAARFATDAAYRKQLAARARERREEEATARAEERFCKWCGDVFTTANKSLRYCRPECAREMRKKQKRERKRTGIRDAA